MIISEAILEGAAFFAIIAYLLEGEWGALVAAVLLLGALITKFPTLPRLQSWLDDQRERLASERVEG